MLVARTGLRLAALAAMTIACSGAAPVDSVLVPPSSPPSPSPSATGQPTPRLPEVTDGLLQPGRYVMLPDESGWMECDMRHCGSPPPVAQTMTVELTVPAGWQGFGNASLLLAPPKSSEGPEGAGLGVGWYVMGLHSDPCLPVAHQTPDIPIGPTVEDFVDAVVAHPLLEVTEPVDAELGGYSGKFLTLTTPSDISDCHDWRPWEHGIPAQGPDNICNTWVMDVEGLRVLVGTEHFVGTSPEDAAELQAMVESIRFSV